jgi:putative protease
MITGPTTGYVETIVSEIRVDNVVTDTVKKGDTFSFPMEAKIRPSDKLYKLIEPIK